MADTIYQPGEATTAERASKWAMKIMFSHDFPIQTDTEYFRLPYRIGRDCVLKRIHGRFRTAPQGSDAIFNVRRNSSDVFTGAGRPILSDGTNDLDFTCDIALLEGDYICWVDVQPGSSTAGQNAVITLEFA